MLVVAAHAFADPGGALGTAEARVSVGANRTVGALRRVCRRRLYHGWRWCTRGARTAREREHEDPIPHRHRRNRTLPGDGQQLRRAVPDHDVRRIARARARCGRRRLPGAPRDRSRADSSRARSAPSRSEPVGLSAQRSRRGRDPLGRARRPDARHADRDADPQRRCAQQGLRSHRAGLPPEPRRLHVRREVRHPSDRRRWSGECARDRRPRRRWRDRAGVAVARRRHDRRVGRRGRSASVRMSMPRPCRAPTSRPTSCAVPIRRWRRA